LKQCEAITASGTRCERLIPASQTLCYSHDPLRKAERSQNASKAARAKNGSELTEIKDALRTLAEDVLSGKVERGRAAVANQLYGTLLRAIEQERKQRELEEFEQRIERLERARSWR